MKTKIAIKDFYGKILGFIETDSSTGDKTVTNFTGLVLGYYKKRQDVTTDFYGRIIARGDASSSLINFDVK